MRDRTRRLLLPFTAIVAVLLAAAAPTTSAQVAGREQPGLRFHSSLTRLSGNRLMYRTWADGYFESLLVELRQPGYKVTSSVLTSEDGRATNATPSTSPCYPAPASYLPHHGVIECPSLLYSNDGHTGVRSVTIVFATNRCYPRNGGILGGVGGPSVSCRR
ncbi:MAG TPA: hypothetical protein VMA83_02890 [Solirubrobacteraceae bacterium]|nr:hypothetical protein [Solirubrobacteraceae bacterium]